MTTIPQLSQTMQTLLTTTTEALATAHGYVKRPDRAKFTPSTLVQTLVYGWLAQPAASVEHLAQMAERLGVEVSPQAIDQRFTDDTATLLQQVLMASVHHVIAADPVAIPILQRFTSVRVHDSTRIQLPDSLATTWRAVGNNTTSAQACLKCGVQFDVLTGALCAINLDDGRASDQRLPIQTAPIPAGSLRLADRGFYHESILIEIHRAGAFWLTRIPTNVLVAYPGQSPQPLATFMMELGPARTVDYAVIVGGKQQLHARLVARRVPQEVADQRRRRILRDAQYKQRMPSQAALTLVDWNIVITNVPQSLLSLAEVMVVMRVRWQIELLFKAWKSYGLVDEWRTGRAARVLCEIYAKLLGMVFHQWILAASSWRDPERSLFKAVQLVAHGVRDLARAHRDPHAFCQVLQEIAATLNRWAKTNKRKKQPTTAQRLLALTDLGK